MVKKLLLFLLLSVFFNALYAQRIIKGNQADKVFKGADLIRYNKTATYPSFIKFRVGAYMPLTSFQTFMRNSLKLGEGFSFETILTQKDEIGYTHIKVQLYYAGIPLEHKIWNLHLRGEEIVSMNGELVYEAPQVVETSISETQALEAAKSFIKADIYKWELESEEHFAHHHEEDGTFKPHAIEVWVSPNFDETRALRRAYKLNIYAHQPLSRTDVWVDRVTGQVIASNEHIHEADIEGTAETKYSGTRTITTDSHNGEYRLRESGRGNGIETYNLNNSTVYSGAVDFTDSDNYWNNFNENLDEAATDAHWGSEMTYDYFMETFNRNSIDDNGFTLKSYVHYSTNYPNAFWDGSRMTYGDGSNDNPFISLDVVGHEITHGLTTNTANLVYKNEPGALNESFSDIFGVAIEHYAKPETANWILGEDMSYIIRSMSNPNSYNQPDTYHGDDWYYGGGDNGGVHFNSGVQNFWFYLLCVGGSGINDNDDAYDLTAIGIDKASAIAYRNLVYYLGANSEYEDAYFYSMQAATDLYGACSDEVDAVIAAWYAVGVAPSLDIVTVSNFEITSSTFSCEAPFDVSFKNLSINAGTFLWEFGDGTTSTEANPIHTYTDYGTFSISLTAFGGDCSNDSTITMENSITIELVEAVVTGAEDSICLYSDATLEASGGIAYMWYDSAVGGNLLAEGPVYIDTAITENHTLYVQALGQEHEIKNIGPEDKSIGWGDDIMAICGLVFDAQTDFTLHSVKVYSTHLYEYTIELQDSLGNVIADTVVAVPEGEQRVVLDFDIPKGEGYVLTIPVDDYSALFSNYNGGDYPYTLNGIVSIKTNTFSNNELYPCFYDWEVSRQACKSERTAVPIYVDLYCDVAAITQDLVQEVKVIPNPTKGNTNLQFDLVSDTELSYYILNTAGQKVLVGEPKMYYQGQQNIALPLQGFSTGMYILHLKTDKGVITEKIVVHP